ncbi:glycosyltransferase family 4 protein [Clostridium sp. SM-530-WT-3G]|uniref:glycosyltransferase family 4 protein n=1 Tax=Clostridium sp. SM-530-WT-3G TaxID=2725303 RepID=UPI00145F78C8|nr:glycosyltransferase family 4 protein [Clostridium sp. SM-530-WT-3G]NME82448.1 glycosyltransferase family 4 protein [Clostridium sp. SM-530-WT-3G]
MKLCFVTNTIFNAGGVQRVVSVIASELSKQHEVTILCTDDSYKLDRSLYNLDKKVSIDMNSKLRRTNKIRNLFGKLFKGINKYSGIFNNEFFKEFLSKAYIPADIRYKFIKYFNENDFDVIIGVEGFYSILIGIISDKVNSKLIGWQHNSYDAYFKNKFKYCWNQDILFKNSLPKLNKYIVLTNYDKRLVDYNFNIDSCRIYNPLSFKSRLKSQGDKKIILFVGRLVIYQKGIDLLIEAFKRICNCEGCEEWILKLVGDGPDKEEILKMINNKNLESRIFVEPFSNNIEQYYVNSSIFVSSSRWEGFGLVIIEAMECGLPVIAFNNSGPKEIIDGTNGILIKNGDIDSLSMNMKNLINNSNERLKLANKSTRRAEDFSREKILKQWNEILYD